MKHITPPKFPRDLGGHVTSPLHIAYYDRLICACVHAHLRVRVLDLRILSEVRGPIHEELESIFP